MTRPKQPLDKTEYAEYLVDVMDEMGDVTFKKMFGGIGFFLEGVMFAKLSGDGTLYFRVDDTNRSDYETLGAFQFNSDSKKKGMPYYQVPQEILDDTDKLIEWAQTAHRVAINNKKK